MSLQDATQAKPPSVTGLTTELTSKQVSAPAHADSISFLSMAVDACLSFNKQFPSNGVLSQAPLPMKKDKSKRFSENTGFTEHKDAKKRSVKSVVFIWQGINPDKSK
jgi:hypothetical protein